MAVARGVFGERAGGAGGAGEQLGGVSTGLHALTVPRAVSAPALRLQLAHTQAHQHRHQLHGPEQRWAHSSLTWAVGV